MTARLLPRSPTIAAFLIILLCLVGFEFRHFAYEGTIPRDFPDAEAWLTPEEHEAVEPAASVKTSRFHYLLPASKSGLPFCYHLASAAANQFPPPILIGWQGVGDLDAAKTHLAKLRAIQRYLNGTATLTNSIANAEGSDDDLVIILDGYDVVLQLPPDVWIERYFEIAARADARLAERFGLSIDELHARGLRQTIFWGPDKFCWPYDARAARCWAVPSFPDLHPPNAEDEGPWSRGVARWLNSGTVIGPLGDMRRYIDATMDEISATYDPKYEHSESDQYYLANVWALQEFSRSLMLNGGDGDDANFDAAAVAAAVAAVPGGPENRVLPPKRYQQTELHVAIEYESALFQTRAGYEHGVAQLIFNGSDLSAALPAKADKPGVESHSMRMPADVEAALTRIYDAVPDAHPGGASAADWIRGVPMGVNLDTRQIYALWHCTGDKDRIAPDYEDMWFRPFVAPLMRANVRDSRAAAGVISDKLIDGRRWEASTTFPDSEGEGQGADELGGAWADMHEGGFVPWNVLCGAHQETLFKGSAP